MFRSITLACRSVSAIRRPLVRNKTSLLHSRPPHDLLGKVLTARFSTVKSNPEFPTSTVQSQKNSDSTDNEPTNSVTDEAQKESSANSSSKTTQITTPQVAHQRGKFIPYINLPEGEQDYDQSYKIPEEAVKKAKIFNWILFAVTTVGLGVAIYKLGQPDPNNPEDREKGIGGYLSRSSDKLYGMYTSYLNPGSDKLLPDPLPAPYQKPYTLVLSLEDLLITQKWDHDHGWRIAKRPGVEHFLAYLCQFYEIVIFSDQHPHTGFPVIDALDPYGYTMYRLFRDSTKYVNGHHVKDISQLNRDLSKIILIDTSKMNADLHPENTVLARKWDGEKGDSYLLSLVPFLEMLATMGIEDVRPIIKGYEGQDIPTAFSESLKRYQAVLRKQAEERQRQQSSSFLSIFKSSTPATVQPEMDLEERTRLSWESFLRENAAYQKQSAQEKKAQEAAFKAEVERRKLTVMDMLQYNLGLRSPTELMPQPNTNNESMIKN